MQLFEFALEFQILIPRETEIYLHSWCPRNTPAFFKGLNFFRLVLGSQKNWKQSTEIFHIPPVPTRAQPPPFSVSLTRVVRFVTTDESILASHNHLVVYHIIIHSLRYGPLFVLHILWIWMYVWRHVSYKIFSLPKSPCFPLIHPSPATPDLFTVCIVLPSAHFSAMSYSWNHAVCSLFRLPAFT